MSTVIREVVIKGRFDWSDVKMPQADGGGGAPQFKTIEKEIKDTTTAVEDYSRKADAAAERNQRLSATIVDMGPPTKALLGHVFNLTRGLVLLGVSSEKDLEKAVRTFAKFEAAIRIIQSTIGVMTTLNRITETYAKTATAAAAAQAAFSATQVGGAGRAGAGALVGGLLGSAGRAIATHPVGAAAIVAGAGIYTAGTYYARTVGSEAEAEAERLDATRRLRQEQRTRRDIDAFFRRRGGNLALQSLFSGAVERAETLGDVGRLSGLGQVGVQLAGTVRAHGGSLGEVEGFLKASLDSIRKASELSKDRSEQDIRTAEEGLRIGQQRLDQLRQEEEAIRKAFLTAQEQFVTARPGEQRRILGALTALEEGRLLNRRQLERLQPFRGSERIEDLIQGQLARQPGAQEFRRRFGGFFDTTTLGFDISRSQEALLKQQEQIDKLKREASESAETFMDQIIALMRQIAGIAQERALQENDRAEAEAIQRGNVPTTDN